MTTDLKEIERKLKEEIYRKEFRKLKILMYKAHKPLVNPLVDKLSVYEEYKKASGARKEELAIHPEVQIQELCNKIKLSGVERDRLWSAQKSRKHKQQSTLRLKPQPEGRDNKDVLARGNGAGYPSSIRYPSKKRSRATWKKFYALFPKIAEQDGWDGKTSKRMK